MQVRLIAEPFDPQAECAAFAAGREDMGALVSFVGLCRASRDGEAISELRIDQYPGFSEQEIARLAGDIARRFECPHLLVIHRTGVIRPGEAIVLAAALCVHRAQAFAAVEALMDYLKTDAPLWKRESGANGSHWIEPRAEDHARRAAREAL